jgi:cobaltochelatase CobN
MLVLAKAVEKVAALKEENNHLRINTLKIKEQLEAQGLSDEEVLRLSTVRIFSNKTGSYGSGIGAIDDSDSWDDEKRLTDNYFETRGYYFGSDTKYWNEKLPQVDLYEKNLTGTQSVIFSRTSNLYGLLTSDDPYGYFGAISLAIRKLDGTNPKTYISNLRDPNNARLQSTAEFMSQELRSRYFHPKWIKAMKEEGYSGTTSVLDVVNNFWGWQVVDPNVVRGDQWNEFVEVYIDDKYDLGLKEWFTKNNPDSLAQITERMIEAYRKGYWKADEKTIKKLLEVYKELEKDFKIKSYNLDFKEFKKNAALGFGLASLQKVAKNTNYEKPKQNKMQKKAAKPKIKGQKLEKVKAKEIKKDYINDFVIALLLLLMTLGLVYELKKED